MKKLDFKNVYDYYTWVVLYENAQGYQEKFLSYCQDYALRTEFPNLDVDFEEHVSGGWFSKEKTRVLGMSFKKSTFKQLGVFFRGQQFGNVLYYSIIKSVDRGMWDKVRFKDKYAKLSEIRDKCKNHAQWEELDSLMSLGDLIFVNAMKELDPKYLENRKLLKDLI